MAVPFPDFFFKPVANCKQIWHRNLVPKISQFPVTLWKQAVVQRNQSAATQTTAGAWVHTLKSIELTCRRRSWRDWMWTSQQKEMLLQELESSNMPKPTMSHKSASLLLKVTELLAKAWIIHKARAAMSMPFRAPTLHSSHLLDEVHLTYSKG